MINAALVLALKFLIIIIDTEKAQEWLDLYVMKNWAYILLIPCLKKLQR